MFNKVNTAVRTSDPAKERFITTFNFLATRRTYKDLKFSTGILEQALELFSQKLAE
jgi:hypothetical protein